MLINDCPATWFGIAGLERALPPHQKWMANRLGPSLQSQARRWSPSEMEEAIVGLLRVDSLMKASGLSDEALLEEWLLARLVAREGRAA